MTANFDGSPGLLDRFGSRLNRRNLAKSGGLLVAGSLLNRVEQLHAVAQSNPSIAATINALITLEAFSVTLYGAARGRGDKLALDGATKPFVLASQCEDEAHYHFFEAAGALSSTTTFTVSENKVSTPATFFGALVPLGSIFVGAYMSAARQFASLGIMRLVEVAYQIGAVEAQHHALARMFAGEKLASDRAFAKWMFNSPADALGAIKDLGYIGGRGETFSFPGPVDRYCRGVTGLVAEATDDQPPPLTTDPSTPIAGDEG
jgi:hypothetical protein